MQFKDLKQGDRFTCGRHYSKDMLLLKISTSYERYNCVVIEGDACGVLLAISLYTEVERVAVLVNFGTLKPGDFFQFPNSESYFLKIPNTTFGYNQVNIGTGHLGAASDEALVTQAENKYAV